MSADVRATAARVIGAVIGGLSLNQVLPEKLNDVGERDRALLQLTRRCIERPCGTQVDTIWYFQCLSHEWRY